MKTKNAKAIILISVAVVALGIIYFCLFVGSKNSIVGEWKIESFIVENEIHPFSEFGTYWGEANQEPMSYFSISFNKDNTVKVIMPTYRADNPTKEIDCTYTIKNDVITLISGANSINIFTIDKDTLQTIDNSFIMEGCILKKQ